MTPAELLRGYRIDELHRAGMRGEGATVIIPAIDTFTPELLSAFEQEYGLPQASVTEFGDPKSVHYPEVDMDVQIVHAVAPEAQIKIVHLISEESRLGSEGAVIDHYSELFPGAIWTWSLGRCEREDAWGATEAIARSVSAGAVHFASSGDNGGYDCYPADRLKDPPRDEYLGGILPSTIPTVTSVGGTRLFVDETGNYSKEWPWYEPAILIGGGGGQSRTFAGRVAPDVAADADPDSGMLFLCDSGAWCAAGGTSASSPLWAGLAALYQPVAKNLKFSLAPFNELLAGLGPSALHDPVAGFNAVSAGGQGDDEVTGLGSPDAVALWSAIKDARG